jgi:hypothetical protein
VPEALPVAWLLRALAAGTASGLTDAGVQTARHLTPDGTSIGRGALDMGGEILGGLISKALPAMAHGLMSSGMNVGKKTINNAMETRSALAGSTVLPHQIDLPAEAIKARIAPGEPTWYTPFSQKETGAEIMTANQADLMTKRAQHLADADARGVTFTRQDFLGPVYDLRAKMLAEGASDKELAAVDRHIAGFLKPGQHPAIQGQYVNMRPSAMEAMKEGKQAAAKAVYAASPKGRASVKARFDAAIAQGIQHRIESLTPSTIPGAPGAIEALNREHRANRPMTEAMTNAEYPRPASGSWKDMNPVHVMSPGARGRAALFLTDPTVKAVGHNLPRAAGTLPFTLMDLLDLAHKQHKQP